MLSDVKHQRNTRDRATVVDQGEAEAMWHKKAVLMQHSKDTVEEARFLYPLCRETPFSSQAIFPAILIHHRLAPQK